jgi:predicted translation initiation factor SUI1
MAKSKRVVLFLSADAASANAAAAAFNSAAARLGLPWAGATGTAPGAEVVVPLDGPAPEGTPGTGGEGLSARVEKWAGGNPDDAVNGLIARLLGGSDEPLPPKPPPPPPPKKVHTVKLGRETAGRKGKGVTVVWELPLTEDQLKELATRLKNACGTGGTAKDGRIEIQGDHRDKIAAELEKLGYKVKRAGG